MFHQYLLGGDTAMRSRLYARLCHAFLDFNETGGMMAMNVN